MATIETSTPQAYGYEAGQGQRLWTVGDTMTVKATAGIRNVGYTWIGGEPGSSRPP